MNCLLNLVKKIVIVIIILAVSFESFSAVVGDNDGDAFVTKHEFEELKKSLDSQLDRYNNSIDNKIDGAIANYLNGIRVGYAEYIPTMVEYAKSNYIYAYSKDDPIEYKYGWPIFWGAFQQPGYTTWGSTNREVAVYIEFARGTPTTNNEQQKTVIKNLKQDVNDAWYAEWKALHKKAVDTLYFSAHAIRSSDGANEPASDYRYVIATGQGSSGNSGIILRNDVSLIGNSLWNIRTGRAGWESLVPGDPAYSRADGVRYIISPILTGAICRGIDHDWGEVSNVELVINKTYDYDMFSNFDRDYNWGYTGNYKTNFINGFSKKNKDVWTYTSTSSGGYNITNNPNILKYCVNGTVSSKVYHTEWSSATVRSNTVAYDNTISLATYTNTDSNGNATFYFPLIGFERSYLTKWAQIVSPNTTNIAEKEVSLNNTTVGIIKGKNDKTYLSVCAGLPVADLEKYQQLKKLSLSFAETGSHIVWFSNRPFDPTKDPQSNNNLLTNTTGSKYTTKGGTYNTTYKGYVVDSQNANFEIIRDDDETEEIIYMKWAKFISPSTIKANSGVKLGDIYVVIQN